MGTVSVGWPSHILLIECVTNLLLWHTLLLCSGSEKSYGFAPLSRLPDHAIPLLRPQKRFKPFYAEKSPTLTSRLLHCPRILSMPLSLPIFEHA